MPKRALVIGVTGQDGAYLAKFLLDKGYEVWGAYRRTSAQHFWRLNKLGITERIHLVCMELSDPSSIQFVIEQAKPDEVYNLAAQSFVGTSFEQPVYTSELNGICVTRILEIIRRVNPKIRFYQASTSEMYGKVHTIPQNEETPFYPRSPYGVAKLYGHWITINYRESYDLYACSGILFNHESPLRGMEFVTRKITMAFAAIHAGRKVPVELGNLEAQRDWGYAGDYVDGIWRILQQDKPDDYVLATGTTTSVRQFAEMAARVLGVALEWRGKGLDETGVDAKTGEVWVKINPRFYRPTEVDILIGDASKAQTKLGWKHQVTLQQLADMMIKSDLEDIRRA